MEDQVRLPSQVTITETAGDVESLQCAAVLWVPDPEARRGWRDYFVKRVPVSKPGRRIGF